MNRSVYSERWLGELTLEDSLLWQYWEYQGRLGVVYTEVGIGGPRSQWKNARRRRIDAVRLLGTERQGIVTHNRKTDPEFRNLICDPAVEHIEVIEVKKDSLGRFLLGQLIVGVDLLEMEYAPAVQIDMVALCRYIDPLMKAVCDRRGINVFLGSEIIE